MLENKFFLTKWISDFSVVTHCANGLKEQINNKSYPQLYSNQSGLCSAASKRKPNLYDLTKLHFIFFIHKKSEGDNCWCWISCSMLPLRLFEALHSFWCHLKTVTSLSQDVLVVPIIVSYVKAIQINSQHDSLSCISTFLLVKIIFPRNFHRRHLFISHC